MTVYVGEFKPQPSLCGGWRLDSVYDISENGLTLTIENGTTFEAIGLPDGLTGKCAHFDATQNLYTISASESDIDIDLSTNAVTLAGWIRVTTAPSAGASIIALEWNALQVTQRGLKIYYMNDGGTYKLIGDFGGNAASYTVTLALNTWYFVVFTAAAGEGAATNLYFNGALVASSTKGTGTGHMPGTSHLIIGGQSWVGVLYKAAAFKKAFTAAEILAWYNYEVGTASTDAYVGIDGTDLTDYVDEESSIDVRGGDLKIDENASANLDFATVAYAGRNLRRYDFSLISNARSTLGTLMGVINNVEALSEFHPFSADRSALVLQAQATLKTALRARAADGEDWWYTADCIVYAYDPLLYGRRQTIFSGHNHVVPTESVSITNNGTYPCGIDRLVASGYFDSGGTTYSTDLTLSVGYKDLLLCDQLLHGDEFTLDRYGHIEHIFYTDFSEAQADLENNLSGGNASTDATAGYHLSGENPKTSLRRLRNDDGDYVSKLYIQVDSESTASLITLDTPSADTTGALIAADLQANIQALGGAYAAVTVQFVDGRYKITSGTTGSASKVRITDALSEYDDKLTYYLKLGTGTFSDYDPDDEDDYHYCDYHRRQEYIYCQGENHDGTGSDSPLIDGAASAGYHTSGALPATVISGQGFHVSGADPATKISFNGKLKIQNDSEASPSEVTVTSSSCSTAANIASHLQTLFRAISGVAYDEVIVRYENSRYVIISGNSGSASKVRITAGSSLDISALLKIGTANGGTDYDGGATILNKFAIQADSEGSPSTVTLTLGQAYTNDPSSGSAITLNMADTSLFANGDTVIVSSSAGYDVTTISNIVANTSIQCASLGLNHTTTNPYVSPYLTGATIARNLQLFIRALGGAYDGVAVTYTNGRYVITSETTGNDSKIRITSDEANDIAARLKLGTANGGTDMDGSGPSYAANALKMTEGGRIMIPSYGPLPVFSSPYIEFTVTALVGTPKVCYRAGSTAQYNYSNDEVVLGYNKIYVPNLQGSTDVYLGISCPEDASLTLYDVKISVRRDLSIADLPTIDPGDSAGIQVSCGGSLKLSNLEVYYRDAFWS